MRVLQGRRRSEMGRVVDKELPALEAFFEYAKPLVSTSCAQLFQDLWALYELDGKSQGYFVEFGATDGHTLSNSFLLEDGYDWTGVLAEPNPTFHDRLFSTRNCHISKKCVFSQSGLTERLVCAETGEFSRLERVAPTDGHETEGRRTPVAYADVETITLDDLLDEYGAPEEIDYLSIDTEGSEFEILNSFDFSRRRISLITVEHNYTDVRKDLYTLLTSKGYVRRWPGFSGFDDWYVLPSGRRAG